MSNFSLSLRSNKAVILSEQSESKDLSAKLCCKTMIMDRFFDSAGAPLRMTRLGVNWNDKFQFNNLLAYRVRRWCKFTGGGH